MPSHRKHRGRNKRRDTTSNSSLSSPSEPPSRSARPSHASRKPRTKKGGVKVADPMVEYQKRQDITDCRLLSPEVLRLCRNVRVQNPIYKGVSDLYIYKLFLSAEYPPNFTPGTKPCNISKAHDKRRRRPSAKQRRRKNFRASYRYIEATLQHLYDMYVFRRQRFEDQVRATEALLKPVLERKRRAVFEVTKSVVAAKLRSRNTLRTLYQVSISSLRFQSLEPTLPP